MTEDRGPVFDAVQIGRPATGALIALHVVEPKAVRLLREAQGK